MFRDIVTERSSTLAGWAEPRQSPPQSKRRGQVEEAWLLGRLEGLGCGIAGPGTAGGQR
jgi:hypothetical protein